MKVRQLGIEGAFEIIPQIHGDQRGGFLELYQHSTMLETVGYPLSLKQANISISAAGVVRGVHYADVPPGQAKYVTCVHGALLDVIVDLRQGSPTFGRWESVRLDDVDRRAVYIGEGLGHAFCALAPDTTAVYMCSESYNPVAEHTIDPLDPQLAIAWPVDQPTLSQRDASAPSFEEAQRAGLLPSYDICMQYTAALRSVHE